MLCEIRGVMAAENLSSPVPFQRATQSPVWEHFDRTGKKECQYKKCGKVHVYAASTSTMLHNLWTIHGLNLGAELSDINNMEGKMGSFVISKPRSTTSCSAAQKTLITDRVVDWLVLDMRPMEIVNDKDLKRLLEYLAPNYDLPSRTHLVSLVKKRHVAARNELAELLRIEAPHMSLTTDGWTSMATQSYNTTTAHFIDSEWKLCACILETS